MLLLSYGSCIGGVDCEGFEAGRELMWWFKDLVVAPFIAWRLVREEESPIDRVLLGFLVILLTGLILFFTMIPFVGIVTLVKYLVEG